MMTMPADGWTDEERDFLREMFINMYRVIPDPIDKFLLMAMEEGCYTQAEIGKMFGISQVAISKRYTDTINKIREARKNGRL